ncbi:MAG: FAD-dependent oxidoreductase [Dysgonamonadaceae bacterium]|nr:FAD-dependent oxidoreductase [Dysgonamonadaceae bacterium]
MKIYDVGIIGGGVSGVVIALQLAELGIDNVLLEQEKSVVNGTPFCHLHAGGNLYPDISDEQCRTLMKQSIEMARLFPQSIDERPTLISIPKTENTQVDILEARLEMLKSYYEQLIEEDPYNAVLGVSEDYYKAYSKEEIGTLVTLPTTKNPSLPDEWMTNAVKLIDYNQLKMPVFLVQEYGWNLFRVGAQAQLALEKTDKCTLKLNTKVENIIDVRNQGVGYNWKIQTNDSLYKVNYLVNSCGFRTGRFDDCLHLNVERLIEFKAAYISQWQPIPGLIPELVFHGERGTSQGMAQLTPYRDDYYQIHGMTENITLFKNGLVKTKGNVAQPEFDEAINRKLNYGWNEDEINIRTEKAIDYVAKFVPSFESATVGGPPLYGAQQIPGSDLSLRVGEVSFPTEFYARSEIVKASSALTVANQIIDKMQEENIILSLPERSNNNYIIACISKDDIDKLAAELTEQRGYPKALSQLVVEKNDRSLTETSI